MIQTAIAETLLVQPKESTPPTSSTYTWEPATSATVTPAATISSTKTTTPSPAFPPTEDLSFIRNFSCLPQTAPYEKVIVTGVIDGDSILVLESDGNTYQVRYIGIDAPELERHYFAESMEANSDLVFQKEVLLIKDVSDKDQFGRLLRYVIAGDVFVNLELIRQGFAAVETYPPDIVCADILSSAEAEARGSQVGIWVATQTPESLSPQVIISAINKKEEWVDIQNKGTTAVNLAGWNLISERGNQECPLSGILAPQEILRIWSMTAQGTGFSCGYSSPIWNNSQSDPAVLYNPKGVEVSRK
jgi:endonuclease YncB( thermonuclease family)